MTSRPLRLVAVPLLAALALAACGGEGSPAPAATVGDVVITDAQVADQAQLYSFLSALSQQPCGGPAPEGESQEAVCNRFALTNMIQESFAIEYAEANELAVEDSQVAEIIANLDQQLGKEMVDEELTKLDLTREDLRTLARQVLLFQDVQSDVVSSELGDAQLREQYEKDIATYTTVDAAHILVDSEAEAQDVYRQVTAPGATDKTFQDLARRGVDRHGVGSQRWKPGSAPAARYVPEFAEAIVSLQPGEISEPVQTEFGWHVIKLVTKQVTPFEQAKAQLVQGQAAEVFGGWVRDQIDESGLEVNPKYGRFDAETLTVVAIDSTDPSATTPPAGGAQSPAEVSPTP